jgi:hypothetical protein
MLRVTATLLKRLTPVFQSLNVLPSRVSAALLVEMPVSLVDVPPVSVHPEIVWVPVEMLMPDATLLMVLFVSVRFGPDVLTPTVAGASIVKLARLSAPDPLIETPAFVNV